MTDALDDLFNSFMNNQDRSTQIKWALNTSAKVKEKNEVLCNLLVSMKVISCSKGTWKAIDGPSRRVVKERRLKKIPESCKIV